MTIEDPTITRRGAMAVAAATAVLPETDPPDMRTSVEHALRFLRETESPRPDDGWLLSPADHPALNAAVLGDILQGWRNSSAEILVPTFEGKRGHPTLFRWSLAEAVFRIPSDRGLNELLLRPEARVQELPIDDPGILLDLDTPSDLAALRRRVPR